MLLNNVRSCSTFLYTKRFEKEVLLRSAEIPTQKNVYLLQKKPTTFRWSCLYNTNFSSHRILDHLCMSVMCELQEYIQEVRMISFWISLTF